MNTFKEQPQIISIRLPITPTTQVQDGCVTASARSFIPHLGIDFENGFLPSLTRYSLDENNRENNHMLGVAVVAAENGLSVSIHTTKPLQDDILPENAPARAKMIHPQIVNSIQALNKQGKIDLQNGQLDFEQFYTNLRNALLNGQYALILLDWDKWNPEVQKKFGNPRHITTVFGIDNETAEVIDPSLNTEENPVRAQIEKLFTSLNNKQQIIFVGKPKGK